MTLQGKLKEYRKKHNLTQRELASKVGVTPAYVALIETGSRKNPSYNTLQKIAKALDISIAELLEDEKGA